MSVYEKNGLFNFSDAHLSLNLKIVAVPFLQFCNGIVRY